MTAVGWAQSCASPETNSSRERASCTPVGWRGCCAFGALRRLPLAPPRRGGAPRLWPLQPLGATLPAGILPPRWLASNARRLTSSPRLPLRRRAGGRGARRGRAAGAGGAGRAARGLGAGAVRLRAGGRLARRAVLRQGGLVHLQLRARGLLGARRASAWRAAGPCADWLCGLGILCGRAARSVPVGRAPERPPTGCWLRRWGLPCACPQPASASWLRHGPSPSPRFAAVRVRSAAPPHTAQHRPPGSPESGLAPRS